MESWRLILETTDALTALNTTHAPEFDPLGFKRLTIGEKGEGAPASSAAGGVPEAGATTENDGCGDGNRESTNAGGEAVGGAPVVEKTRRSRGGGGWVPDATAKLEELMGV